MRQAGVVAAMGLYAIENNVQRLADDHENAQRLAQELARHGFVIPRNGVVDTNLFYFKLPLDSSVTKEEFLQRLNEEHGVKIGSGYSRNGDYFRVVTHMDVSATDVDRAAKAMVAVLNNN